MCSIAGGGNVKKKLELMRHRAPDDEGIVDEIGMGRLAIIDLKSEGLCPLSEDGYTIAYNGEVYNYKEIRSQLKQLGYSFRTESDTEVVLKAYMEWGQHCLDKFNGMFAFAIKKDGEIFLARDIAGQKPLYYKEDPFEFASENKALNFKGKEFPPASYATYKPGMKLHIKKWWKFTPTINHYNSYEEAENELEYLLEDSVRLRTQSDVPYAVFYSGGVDSSLIRSFHTFEHEYTYDDTEEYKDEFLEVFPKILYHLDEPISSFSAFGLWKLSEAMASDGIKVVLSGEGADELFGGYIRYVPDSLYREAQQHFPSYRKMFPYTDDVNSHGWREFNGNMRELLRMGDRMTSAFGIENRCPFLDRRIIEFAFSLPPDYKIQGFNTKILLNNILKKRVPDYKPIEKKGLYCSVNKWLGEKDPFDKEVYKNYQEKIWKSYQS